MRRAVLLVAMVAFAITLLLQVSSAADSDPLRVARSNYDELLDVSTESRPATVVRRANSHPHMNNLVFGRRSLPTSSLWKTVDQLQQVQGDDEADAWRMAPATVRREVQSMCQSMVPSCARCQYLHEQLTTESADD